MPHVSATAVFTYSRVSDLAKRIEQAMAAAAQAAMLEGISDQNVIRSRMLAARASIKDGIEERDDLAVSGKGRPKKPK